MDLFGLQVDGPTTRGGGGGYKRQFTVCPSEPCSPTKSVKKVFLQRFIDRNRFSFSFRTF